MRDWDWQLMLALLIVVLAAGSLLRRGLRFWSSQQHGGCHDGAACRRCPSTTSTRQADEKEHGFVPLDSLQGAPQQIHTYQRMKRGVD